MRYASLFVLSFFLWAQTGIARAAVPLLEERIGNWTLIAHTQSDVGPFTHCTATTKLSDGLLFILTIIADETPSFTLVRSGWKVPVGTQPILTYQVDAHPARRGRIVADAETIRVPLPRDAALSDQFPAGKVLKVEFDGQSRQIAIDGLAAAIPVLVDCVRGFRGQVVEALAPVDMPPAPADLQAATRQALAEAVNWARQMSAAGAMPRVALMTPEEMANAQWRGFFKGALAGWYSDNVLVRLKIYNPNPVPLSKTAADLFTSSTKKCDDDFTVVRGGRDDRVIGIYVDCAIDSQRLGRATVMFKDKNGFLYYASFLGTADGGDTAAPHFVAEDFRHAGLALLAQP